MKKAALAALFTAVLMIAMAYAVAVATGGTATWTAWVMVFGTSLSMVATMVLGAARSGRPGGVTKLLPAFAAVFLTMVGAFVAALTLPGESEPLILGLPRRAAFVLYGIGVFPLLILPLAYALTFDELTLTQDDIERVRQAAERNAAQQ